MLMNPAPQTEINQHTDAPPEQNAITAVGPDLAASAKQFSLAPGLYAVTIGDAADRTSVTDGVALPITNVQVLGWEKMPGSRVFATGAEPGWAGPRGGTIVIQILPPGGRVLMTTYRPSGEAPIPLSVKIAPLGHPAVLPGCESQGAVAAAGSDRTTPESDVGNHPSGTSFGVTTRITLALREIGEIDYSGDDWAGEKSGTSIVEAFSVMPLNGVDDTDLEYKAFGPNGLETPWVRGARLCGSRGRGIALTGFAVRVSPRLQGKFDVVYQGAFTNSGHSAPHRNGEPCKGTDPGDCLEGVRIGLQARH
ncbi:MAG: hypothetical protein F8N39_06890 [Clostridiaceae bacterium]|nr:hypothetical protein [Clostridiaceae bacterium]